MPTSPTVLQWQDIGVLVELCTRPASTRGGDDARLDRSRRELVEAVLAYLREWLPDAMIENETRAALYRALEHYSSSLEDFAGDVEVVLGANVLSGTEDILKRLLLAMEMAEAARGPAAPDTKIGDAMVCLALFLAANGSSLFMNG